METKRSTPFAKRHSPVGSQREPGKASSAQAPQEEASLPVLPLAPRLIFLVFSLVFLAAGIGVLWDESPECAMPRANVEVVDLAPNQQGEIENPVLLTAYGEQLIWAHSIESLAEHLDDGLPFSIEAHRVAAGTYRIFDSQGAKAFIRFSGFFLLIAVCILFWKFGHQSGNTMQPLFSLPPTLHKRICNRILLTQGILLFLGWGTWSSFLGWDVWLLIWLIPIVAMVLVRFRCTRLITFGFLGIFIAIGLSLLTLSLSAWYAPSGERSAERVVAEPLFHRVVTHSTKHHGTWQEREFLIRYECRGETHYGILGTSMGGKLAQQLQVPNARIFLNHDPKSPFPEQLYVGSFPKDRIERFWIVFAIGCFFCILPAMGLLASFIKKRRATKKEA